MAKLTKDNLGYLGEEFQYRLVKAFIETEDFFTDLKDAIDQNMFTDPNLRTVVGIIKEYANKYNEVPSYDILTIKLNEYASNGIMRDAFGEIVNKIKTTSCEGHVEIEDLAEKFFFQQNIIKVSNELRTLAASIDNYDKCRQIMEDALAVGRKTEQISCPIGNPEVDLDFEAQEVIPTGISVLDDLLGGGLEKGKMGLIICPMGFGKTSMTTGIAYNAALRCDSHNNFDGYKVLQIVFEDTHLDMRRKYYGRMSEIEISAMKADKSNVNLALERINSMPEICDRLKRNIEIMRLPSGDYSASEIKSIILKRINKGFRPDLVILDYFGCLKFERGMGKDDITMREGTTMRKLETMCAELNIAMWMPAQSNREGLTAEVVTQDNVGGSITKGQIAQVVLSISRTLDELHNNRATIALLKQRTGIGGVTLPNLYFNNGTCVIKDDNQTGQAVDRFDVETYQVIGEGEEI